MPTYQNLGGDSGVASFEIFEDAIEVTFTSGACYRYTDESAGAANIARMKSLALAGQGLNSFIQRNVRKLYDGRC